MTGKHWKNTDSSQATPGIHLRMSDVYRLNCLTSVAVIPTLSPALNARSKFSFCKSVCVRDHFKTDFKINPEQNPEQMNTHSFETLLVFLNSDYTLSSGLSDSYGMRPGRNV